MKPATHLAFLIGVQEYQHLQPLKTPLNDIRDLGQLLAGTSRRKRAGFNLPYQPQPDSHND